MNTKEKDNMALDIEKEQMLSLLRDFHLLTGFLIILLDTDHNPIMRYPSCGCRFCQCMKDNPATEQLCVQSDYKAFTLCQEKQGFVIYHCHAGLVEACAPIRMNGKIIGYLMFGQISDMPDSKLLNLHLKTYARPYLGDSIDSMDLINDIPLKSPEIIQASAKLMEACTLYAVYENSIRVRKQNFITNMETFLMEHISEDLSVARITKELGISRSKLYQVCDMYLDKSIAAYILELRIKHAKKLLLETDLSISELAVQCGFNDYNYFCRVFKKETGISAGKYRKCEQAPK